MSSSIKRTYFLGSSEIDTNILSGIYTFDLGGSRIISHSTMVKWIHKADWLFDTSLLRFDLMHHDGPKYISKVPLQFSSIPHKVL